MTELSVSISAGANDGSGRSGSFSTSGTTLYFGDVNGNPWHGFLLFSVNIPSGSTISSAIIQFKSSGDNANTTCNLTIGFESSDNPTAPTTYDDMVGRTLGDLVAWNNVSGWSIDTWYDSPDLKEELQAVISREGWASGQNILAVIKSNSSSYQAHRDCRSYDYGAASSPKLVVNYTAPQLAGIDDAVGANDSVDAFNLTDTITDAASLGDSIDAYNLHEQLTQAAVFGDEVLTEAEYYLNISDTTGLGDTIGAVFEADGVLTDSAALGDSSDALNWTNWYGSNRDRSVIRYYCTLTGANDNLTDLSIPISSFQARKRSGEQTYLSVVVPGMALADSISDRLNGELVIDLAYLVDGVESLREEILRVDLEQINPSIGPRSRSITLIGHKTVTYDSRSASIQGSNYKYENDGLLGFRFPQADPYLNPGDSLTVVDTNDVFTVDYITYVITARGAKFMEVREG